MKRARKYARKKKAQDLLDILYYIFLGRFLGDFWGVS